MEEIRLDPEGLQERARRAVDESPYTQADVARELDVSRGSITQALNDASPRLEKLRCRIVELLEPCEVERRRTFVLHPNN
jgi:DNA-binding XRE family transcriptional regulator